MAYAVEADILKLGFGLNQLDIKIKVLLYNKSLICGLENKNLTNNDLIVLVEGKIIKRGCGLPSRLYKTPILIPSKYRA
jgi:hypothetical protein